MPIFANARSAAGSLDQRPKSEMLPTAPKRVAKLMSTLACMSLLIACVPVSAYAQCYNLSFPTSPISPDNVADTGSPFTYTYYNENSTLWVQHGSAPAYIMQDNTPTLSGGSSTGLSVGSNGLGDITATQLGANVYLSYLNANNILSIAVSPTNVGWPNIYPFSITNANQLFTPTIIAYNGKLVAAYVVGNSVYIATSTNGKTFTVSSDEPVNSNQTISRPAMAVLGNTLYVGYTNGSRQLVIGPVFVNGGYAPSLAVQSATFGYKNAKGAYAGVALLADAASKEIWVFGEETVASQYFAETSGTGTSFAPETICTSAQLRWTPSISQIPSLGDFTLLVFQGAHNTNLYYGAN